MTSEKPDFEGEVKRDVAFQKSRSSGNSRILPGREPRFTKTQETLICPAECGPRPCPLLGAMLLIDCHAITSTIRDEPDYHHPDESQDPLSLTVLQLEHNIYFLLGY